MYVFGVVLLPSQISYTFFHQELNLTVKERNRGFMNKQCIYSKTCKNYTRASPDTFCRKFYCCSYYFSVETFKNNKKNIYYCLYCGKPLGINLPECGKLKLVPQNDLGQICSLCCQKREEKGLGSSFDTLDF